MISASGIRQGFCRLCYADAINRLCTGWTITRPGGQAVAIPPLDPGLAAAVRRAAQEHLERPGPGDAARHPHHTGR